jgi:hypothetical protein
MRTLAFIDALINHLDGINTEDNNAAAGKHEYSTSSFVKGRESAFTEVKRLLTTLKAFHSAYDGVKADSPSLNGQSLSAKAS